MNIICPHCKTELTVTKEMAGTNIQCSVCQKEFYFPTELLKTHSALEDIIWRIAGILFSILFCVGLIYGCGSWFSYLEKEHSNKQIKEKNKLPVAYRDFIDDFYKEEVELLYNAVPFHLDVLSKSNRKQIWEEWNVKIRDYLMKKEKLLSKFSARLNSVNNPPESEFIRNSIILDDFSWEIKCDKIRLDAMEKRYNLYDTNDCCWTVQDEKIIYLDETFRKKAEVEMLKYFSLLDRLDKSMKDD